MTYFDPDMLNDLQVELDIQDRDDHLEAEWERSQDEHDN